MSSDGERERELIGRVMLGEDVQSFLRSTAGKYLHGRAAADLEQVKEDLLDCNPWTPWGRRRIKKLQQKADCARNFMRYCVDAIQDGQAAALEYEDRK